MSTSPPQFCDACDNMMFLSMTEDQKMVRYKCPNCQKEEVVGSADGKKTHVVYSMAPKSSVLPRTNPHMASDPTLPRMALKCPKCPNTKDIVVMRVDEDKLHYMCFCDACKTRWVGEDEV
jgi:DNA-directed RNA polymerase subunit M/transcription elongation factor TFIIS